MEPSLAVPSSSTPGPRDDRRGQALVEFAIVFPVFFLVIAGIIQFGLIFWSQQTLTQVARDTGRWAATQDCYISAAVVAEANAVAQNSTLFGYTSWDAANVSAFYDPKDGAACPPADNTEVAWVTVTIDHQVPIFFPFVPGDGNLSTSAEFRMEPKAR